MQGVNVIIRPIIIIKPRMIPSEISVQWKVPEIVFVFDSRENLHHVVLQNTDI